MTVIPIRPAKKYYRRGLGMGDEKRRPPRYKPNTARLIRQAFEEMALKIERLPGSKPYCTAYRHAADVIRKNKPD
jgi:hypothetical protein